MLNLDNLIPRRQDHIRIFLFWNFLSRSAISGALRQIGFSRIQPKLVRSFYENFKSYYYLK
ncbi:hypothetical protein Lrub_1499 [Legionella rubrilucens]|uniref:Uncharacterized protein n=1 Tax=Legionella rubrilucens TaxID=458 RepID=A0A0W0XV26_9GAMM|nr:hypothetical protein Lrub_1499 [Legionella rubrilucens]